MEIDFIPGPKTEDIFGISKYSSELRKRLNSVTINSIEYPILAKGHRVDGFTKRFLYPSIVRKKIKYGNVKHITNQDYAFLIPLVQLHPVVVTCHDIIPWTYYGKRSFLWQLNMKGLKKANRIITVSEFSKTQIIENTGFREEYIHVIPNGVDHSRYYPNPDRSILTRYGITNDDKVILYVGSEEPRKNFQFLLKSFAALKDRIPTIKLLKVGGPGLFRYRTATLKQIHGLGLQNEVIFTGFIPEEELPTFYNAADLFVFPSFIEGFGLPPLEAMSCGCPVIAANTSSLPEVVGDGGILVNTDDNIALTESMESLVTDKGFARLMSEKALARSYIFTWEETTEKTLQIYYDLKRR